MLSSLSFEALFVHTDILVPLLRMLTITPLISELGSNVSPIKLNT